MPTTEHETNNKATNRDQHRDAWSEDASHTSTGHRDMPALRSRNNDCCWKHWRFADGNGVGGYPDRKTDS